MIQVFKHVNIDWLGKRRGFIFASIILMLIGMGSALYRHQFHPNIPTLSTWESISVAALSSQ